MIGSFFFSTTHLSSSDNLLATCKIHVNLFRTCEVFRDIKQKQNKTDNLTSQKINKIMFSLLYLYMILFRFVKESLYQFNGATNVYVYISLLLFLSQIGCTVQSDGKKNPFHLDQNKQPYIPRAGLEPSPCQMLRFPCFECHSLYSPDHIHFNNTFILSCGHSRWLIFSEFI